MSQFFFLFLFSVANKEHCWAYPYILHIDSWLSISTFSMNMRNNTNSTIVASNLSDSNIPNADEDHGETYAIAFYIYCIVLPVAVIGLIGNCLNFVLFSLAAYRRQSFAVYLRALAVSDSLVLLIATIQHIDGEFLSETLNTTQLLCPFSLFFSDMSSALSSFLVIVVAVDRYIAVVYPLHRPILCTYRRAVIVTAIVVLLSAAMSLITVIWNEIATVESFELAVTNFTDIDYMCPMVNVEVMDLYMSTGSLIYLVLGPVVIVSTINIRIFVAIKSRAKLCEVSSSSREAGVPSRTTLTLIMATFSSVLFFIPILCVEFLEFTGQFDGRLDRAWQFASGVQLMNNALNFYIFILNGQEYRAALRRVFGLNQSLTKPRPSIARSNTQGNPKISKSPTVESVLSSD